MEVVANGDGGSGEPAKLQGKYKALLVCWILGFGSLVSWNSMLTIGDYYYNLFPNYHPSRVLTLVYQPFALGTMAILAYHESKIDTRKRNIAGYLLFFASTLMLLVLDFATSGKGGVGPFVGICVIVGAFGVADAHVQGGMVGDLSFMCPEFMQSFFAGLAASGVMTSALRLVTKAAFENAHNGLRKGVQLFLAIATFMEFLCFLLYAFYVPKLPIVKYYRAKAAKEGSKTVSADLKAAGIQTPSEQLEDDNKPMERLSMRELLVQNWDYALDLYFIYVLTLSIFPGFISEDTGTHQLGSWYILVLIAAYNALDLVGRYIPLIECIKLKSRYWLTVAILSRFLLIPAFYFTAKYGDQGYMIALTSFLGLTNGYLTVCVMTSAPKGYTLQRFFPSKFLPVQKKTIVAMEDATGRDRGTAEPAKLEGKYKALFVCWILGFGCLASWNSMLTIGDYYYNLFPKYHPSRVLTLVYQPFALGTMAILAYNEAKIDTRKRNVAGYLLFFAGTLMLLVLDFATSGKGGVGPFVGICVIVAAFGLADAHVEGGMVGELSLMCPEFIQSFFAGLAASGVMTSVLRFITKAAFENAHNGLRKGVRLFLAIATFMELLCFLLYAFYFPKLPIVKYYRSKAAKEGSKTVFADLKAAGIQTPSESSGDDSKLMDRLSIKELLIQNWDYALDLFLIYVLTLSIFPGFISEDTGTHQLGSWYILVLIAAYNALDLVGRYVPLIECIKLKSRYWLTVTILSRFLLIPAFYFTAKYGDQGWMIFLTSFLGLTNGYLTVCVMTLAPKGYTGPEQNALGNLLVFFLLAGIFAGVVLDWMWLIGKKNAF
ncbi:Equilibrative nucleotide transporter 3 [Linum grandiflorum]